MEKKFKCFKCKRIKGFDKEEPYNQIYSAGYDIISCKTCGWKAWTNAYFKN